MFDLTSTSSFVRFRLRQASIRHLVGVFSVMAFAAHGVHGAEILNGASGSVPYATDYSTDTGLILSLGFEAEYLVVGGGGSGGTAGGSGGQDTWGAGGGGAGGLLTGAMNLDPKSYNVTVGAGGLAAAYSAGSTSTGRDGLPSILDTVTALGGGGGAGGENANGGVGRSGGSGGGGGSKYANVGGSGTSPQGYAGGSARNGDTSSAGNRTAGGGGGGAGGAGENAEPSNSVAGAGGVGKGSEITGNSVVYAGGGGGGARDLFGGQQAGAGGTGGGGAGSTQSNATSGTNGLGGGGGGSGADGKGGDGGSGLVIVRYKGAPAGAGGTVSTGTGSAAGYTLHTFNTVGASSLDLSGLVLNDRLGAVLSGVISGDRDLTFNGPGALTLTAANTFSGNTVINAGRIVLGNALALQTSTLDTGSAGHIDATGVTTPTFGGLKGSAALSNLISSGYSGITTLTFNTPENAGASYSGVIAEGATGMNIVKTGSGTQILTGTNTYTGSTTVSGGILAVGGNSIPNSGDLFINGGKVAATGTEVVRLLYFNGVRQPLGTYGATGSGATYIDDAHFSGTAGVVEVTEGFAPSTTSLSGFSTTTNFASASQSFTVNGRGLSGPVVVTAPAGFEVSTDNSTFSPSLTLSTQASFIESVYGGDFNTASGTIWTNGSGREFPNSSAFAAVTGSGSVVTWGSASWGGDSTAVADKLASNVVAVYSNSVAFAALKTDGSVVTWGNASWGGDSTAVADKLTSNVTAVYSTSSSFAALKTDGSVVNWGRSYSGANSTEVADKLASDVRMVYSNEHAFAALKSDGSVVTWGSAGYGGDSTAVADKLASNVVAVYSNSLAFVALKTDGSVVTWGDANNGGNSSAVADMLTSNVTKVFSTRIAFAALKTDGSVVTWGNASSGANSAVVADKLTSNVTKVFSTGYAFAALKSNGSVVTWGSYAGDSTEVAGKLTSNVTAVYSTLGSFAALKSDGSVVTWGESGSGGDSTAVADKLTSNVTKVYSTTGSFAALKTDGSLVTWGGADTGGNSTAVADKLTSDVQEVFSTQIAFAALKTDGSVVTWGNAFFGGAGGPANIGVYALPATLYIRLASAAPIGSVSGNLTLASIGFTTQTVALSGTVTDGPTYTHQELWRFANFGSYDSVSSGADSADPDGDGLSNLMEYALGTAPNASGVIPAVLSLNGANLEYTYTRSSAAKDNGIIYQIEWSDTLEAGSWSTETVTQQITSTEGALESVKASVPAGTGGKRFLRLRVGAAPLQTP
jgi:autotransporter-associated beta strand protein